MNGYILTEGFGLPYGPPEKVHADMFKGANKKVQTATLEAYSQTKKNLKDR